MGHSGRSSIAWRIVIACLLTLSAAALVIAAPPYLNCRTYTVVEAACASDGYC
jgi:hypothetical protein